MLPILLAAGFQLVHPLPVADTLRDVHVMPDGQVWIVGDHGIVLRIDRTPTGPALTRIQVPNTPTVATVFDDIERSFGSNVPPSTQRFPGSQFMPLDFETIVASGPKDVWIALGTESIVHWDGASWTWHDDTDAYAGDALMLDAAGELWTWGGFGVVFGPTGQAPRILSQGNGQWTFRDGPMVKNEKRIRALARQGDDVWAVGFDGALLRSRAGAPWKERALPDPKQPMEDFWGLWLDEAGTAGLLNARDRLYLKRGNDFVLGPKIDGSIADVFAFPGGDPAWVVSDDPYLLSGGVATKVPIAGWKPPETRLYRVGIEAVHGRSPDDVWMVGEAGLILHWDGKELRELFPRVTEQDLVGLVWEGEDGWLAASGDGQLLRGALSGGLTSVSPGPFNDPETLIRLPSGEVLLHALCNELSVLTPTRKWRALPEPPGCVKAVGGLSSKDLWGAGSHDLVDGKVYRFNGNEWREIPAPTDMELEVIAVEPDGTAWIGGDRVLLKATGGKDLVVVETHEFDEYKGFALTRPGDLWIAGDSTEIGSAGMILRWTGGKLARNENLTANYLNDVVIDPSGQLWAVGLGGVAARSTEAGFEAIDTGTGATLRHIYAHPSGALIAIGDDGTILQRDAP